MGTVELPVYGWRYYNVGLLVDLGLQVSCEEVVLGNADVDIDGDTRYLRESGRSVVWFRPEDPCGYRRADHPSTLVGTGLAQADLTWNGGGWMPVLEPVTELVPNWEVLGMSSVLIGSTTELQGPPSVLREAERVEPDPGPTLSC